MDTRIRIHAGSPDPVEVTPEHRTTSSELLTQLCALVSSDEQSEVRTLHVRVGHYEHPGFLSPVLYGFWMMPIAGIRDETDPIPGLARLGVDWAVEALKAHAPPTHLRALLAGSEVRLQSPNESTPDRPSTWVCIMNASVEAQLESTLTSIAMLIARQRMILEIGSSRVETLPDRAARVDGETARIVNSEIRERGWQSAARAIRARARAAGFSLHIRYRSHIADRETSWERMPLQRHVYNTFPKARSTIDAIVHSLVGGWTIGGAAPERALRQARHALEELNVVALTALCARDAFVCGTGALAMGGVPLNNPWLVRPEDIISAVPNESRVVVRSRSGQETIAPALAMVGATQPGTDVALGILEPLVLNSANRDLFLRVLLQAEINLELASDLPDEVVRWARETRQLAIDQLESPNPVDSLFNPVVHRLPEPGASPYISGFGEMAPSSDRLSVGSA